MKIFLEKIHGFIYAGVFGLFSFIFNVFGENHYINNWNSDSPISYCVKSINNNKERLITINDSNDL